MGLKEIPTDLIDIKQGNIYRITNNINFSVISKCIFKNTKQATFTDIYAIWLKGGEELCESWTIYAENTEGYQFNLISKDDYPEYYI